MSVINTPPYGLQSLLGAQNFGDNPSELASTVVPTAELFELLGSSKLDVVQETRTVTAPGQAASIDVPTGELWLVTHASLRVQYNANGDQMQYVIDMTSFPSTTVTGVFPLTLARGVLETQTINSEEYVLIYQPTGRFVPVWSDTRLRALCLTASFTGLAENYPNFQVQFYRLKI